MARYTEGYNRLPDGRSIWLVQADDGAGWNWDSFFEVLPSKFDRWGGDEWIRSKPSIKRVRDEFQVGDIVVCYQGAPKRAVVGLARVSSEGYAVVRGRPRPGGTFFDMDWGCVLAPVAFETLRADPVLSEMEKVHFAQGTVFRVSHPELARLLALTEPIGPSIPQVESALNITWPTGPTSDAEELARRTANLLTAGPVARPAGVAHPRAVARPSLQYQRDPAVRAFVLQVADGTCELCHDPAPFTGVDGLPYLEVHHVQHLADGGPDTVENAVALCPNCHRLVHVARERAASVEKLHDIASRRANVTGTADPRAVPGAGPTPSPPTRPRTGGRRSSASPAGSGANTSRG
jgi:5-methylcytosine-specific restriction endonuclease McrA